MRRICLLIVGLFICVGLAMADAPRTGLVSGIVFDPEGAQLPGATVQLEGDQGILSAVTNDEGGFRFMFVAPGPYTVRADLAGFGPAAGDIIVSAGGRAEVELQLTEVMGQEIVVTSEVPLISRHDATSGGTLDRSELNLIPSDVRSINSTLNFLPGVANDASSQNLYQMQPEVNGHNGGRPSFFVDGVDTSFSRFSGATRLFVPTFAVAEVKLEATGADAEYSRSMGGTVVTTLKSGANDFHGEINYYLRNADWDDQYDYTPVPQPDKIENSIELALGGPIVRDKLWFLVGWGDRTDPGWQVLADGVSVVDMRMIWTSELAKLDWRPNNNHSLFASYAQTPVDAVTPCPGVCADIYSLNTTDWAGELLTTGWDWAINDSLFLESRIASQNTDTTRIPLVDKPIDPDADPWQPAGNSYAHFDLAVRAFYNGMWHTDGIGPVAFPRDQFNTALNFFAGNHDLKIGLDYQKVAWESGATAVPRIYGRGFNEVPGGFNMPLFIRYYLGPEPGEKAINDSEAAAIFARDRITTNRWTFNLGLRVDQQEHKNDTGEVTVDSTDISPRLAAVYDIRGDGQLLVSASAGRYLSHVPQQWSAYFNDTPTGIAAYDQYGWNPATQDYDRYQGRTEPSTVELTQVDPYDKIEYTLGLDWAFHPIWAFKTKLVYWEMEKIHQYYEQLDGSGGTVTVAENHPFAELSHTGIHFVLQRRFKNRWSLATSYSYAETTGNCGLHVVGHRCQDYPGELIDLVNPETGVPWTVENRDGELPTSRPHLFKARGLYQMPLGHGHSINISGLFYLQSGQPWERIETVPVLNGTRTVIHYAEPRGSNRNPTQKQLNLSLEWAFPIIKTLNGALALDITNATNEQVVIGTMGLRETGAPLAASLNYQRPRYYRLMAKIAF